MTDTAKIVCRLCGGERTVVLLRSMKDRFISASETYSLSKCLHCGVIFTSPSGTLPNYPPGYGPHAHPSPPRARNHPTRDRIRKVYYGHGGSIVEYLLLLIPFLIFRFRDWYKMRNKNVYENAFRNNGGRLLDVGCGRGHYLRMWMRGRDQAIGVEPHEATARAAREETGLDIRHGTMEAQAFPSYFFDSIAFCHVLEHIKDPQAALREACRLLKPGGEVVIWVPNFNSMFRPLFGRDWLPYDIPRHLWHMTPGQLTTWLKDALLEPTDISMDPNEFSFRRSVQLLRESGHRVLAWILDHRYVRQFLGMTSSLFRRTDVIRIRARKKAEALR